VTEVPAEDKYLYLVSNLEALLVELELAGGGDLEHEGSVFEVFWRAVPFDLNENGVPLSLV